jgi:hypothetical protein
METIIQLLSEAAAEYKRASDAQGQLDVITQFLWKLKDERPSNDEKIFLKAVIDPFLAARLGNRHELTSLPRDIIANNIRNNPYRERAHDLGAAIVVYFSRGNQRTGEMARHVSKAMGRGGLFVERSRRRSDRLAPPGVSTILKDVKRAQLFASGKLQPPHRKYPAWVL